MKKIILGVTAIVISSLTSCNDKEKEASVARRQDSLMAVINERESSINEFVNSFSEIEGNLDLITKKEHIILTNSDKKDVSGSKKDVINREIEAINELMEVNRKKIDALNKKLNRSDKKNYELKKTIEFLNNQLNQKNIELAELNERLNSLNMQVTQLQTSMDTLRSENLAQSQTINEKIAEIHTAYYIVGTSKELEKANLIDKKGGVLGIGKTSELSGDLDNSKFTKIDYTQTTSIPVNGHNAKIITTHPSGSYNLEKDGKTLKTLVITDPDKFWSTSKYLVITK